MDEAPTSRLRGVFALHRLECTYCFDRKVRRKNDACSPCKRWLREYSELRPADLKCANPGCGNAATCTDHDHETGSIRGDLCVGCNQAEGLLKGDPAKIRRLANYVEFWGNRPRSMAAAMEQRRSLAGQMSLDMPMCLLPDDDDALFPVE